MVAAIDLDEHAFPGHAFASAAILGGPSRPRRGEPCVLQDAAEGRIGHMKGFPLREQILEMLVVHMRVHPSGQAHDALAKGRRQAARRGAAAVAMDQGARAAAAVLTPQAAGLADRKPDEAGGLRHCHLAPLHGVENNKTLFSPCVQRDLSHSALALRGSRGRTFSLAN